MKMTQGKLIGALMLLIVVIWLIVGTMSYSDEINGDLHYCKMVDPGYWKNYKDIDCGVK